MKKLLTSNIKWKIVSLVLAFFIWLFVTNYEDPVTIKEIKDIPIEVLNKDKLLQGKEAMDVSYTTETVDITVKGRRKTLDNLSVNSFVATANMYDLKEDWELVPIKIEATIETPDDVEIVSQSEVNLIVSLEPIRTTTKNIEFDIQGTAKEGYEIDYENVEMDKTQVILTGPESKINSVATVLLDIDIGENNTSNVIQEVTPKILDSSGKEVTNIEIEAVDIVKVEVPINLVKTVPIEVTTKGELPDNYTHKNNVLSIEQVEILGPEKVVNSIDEISIEIDITGLTQDKTEQHKFEEYLHEDVKVRDIEEVTIKILIGELIEKRLPFDNSDIEMKNVPRGMEVDYTSTKTNYIVFEGLEEDIDELDINDLELSIDLANIVEEGLYSIYIDYTAPPDIKIVGSIPQIDIMVTK